MVLKREDWLQYFVFSICQHAKLRWWTLRPLNMQLWACCHAEICSCKSKYDEEAMMDTCSESGKLSVSWFLIVLSVSPQGRTQAQRYLSCSEQMSCSPLSFSLFFFFFYICFSDTKSGISHYLFTAPGLTSARVWVYSSPLMKWWGGR